MKVNSIFRIFPFFLFLLIVLPVHAQTKKGDILFLENSMIIKELSMESDEPLEDSGAVIYDDDFADTIIDYNNIRNNNKQDQGNEKGSILKRLRVKDPRWHFTEYTVRKHDSIWKIAKRFSIHHNLILEANELSDPDLLRVGRKIAVPNRRGVYHRVKKGDTLNGISGRYAVNRKKIIAHNGIKKYILHSGSRIFIPDARMFRSADISADRRRVCRSLKLLWPLRGKITSGFGTRRDPFSNKRSFHCGVDISANVGTPVKSADDGKVIFSGWKTGYGKVVIMRHGDGFITVYAHNSRNLVTVGQEIKRGTVIASSGNTGAVTGAHLHFEIRKYVTPLNPMRFLK